MSDPEHVPDDMRTVHETRRIMREAGQMIVGRGQLPPDVAMGLVYAALDIAETFAGEGMGGVEWLRTACDVMEATVASGAPRLEV